MFSTIDPIPALVLTHGWTDQVSAPPQTVIPARAGHRPRRLARFRAFPRPPADRRAI